MKFLEALSQTIIPAKLRENISPEFGNVSGDPDSDAHLYRSMTTGARDLSEFRLTRAANIAYWLWLTNPYAKRGLDILSDFIVGTGITIEAEDPKTKKVLEDFWYGKPWCFEQKLNDYLNVLHLFGELVLPFEVNTQNGKVSIAYIDSSNIESIVINPQNALEMLDLKVKNIDKPFVIVNDSEKAIEDGITEGVFLFQINKIVNAVRGSGCLLSSIDLLASLDDFLFAEIERTMMLRNFIWDIQFEGASETEIKKWVSDEERKPPRPGSIRGHNEKVTWNAVTPDLKTSDSQNIFKILFNSVAVGLGVPEHWLGAVGYDINRACYSADTEVLTIDGFKKHNEIEKGDLVAVYDFQNDNIKYEKILAFYEYDYNGEMYHFQTNHIDVLVTPEHKMLVKRDRNDPNKRNYEIIQAQQIIANKWYFKNNALLEIDNQITSKDFITIPKVNAIGRTIYEELIIPMDIWVEFLGYWLSEGHARTIAPFIVNLSQKDIEKKNKIEACLSKLPIKFKKGTDKDHVNRWQISDKPLANWLTKKCGDKSHSKHFPEGWQKWSPELKQIFFDALMLGDGSIDSRDGRNCAAYYTNSDKLRDDVQTLIMFLGHRVKATNGTRCHRLLITLNTNESQIHADDIKKENYNGKIYCLSTSTGFYITRRNGIISIQGNTAAEMSLPIFKYLQRRQKYIKSMFELMFDFVLANAVKYGYETGSVKDSDGKEVGGKVDSKTDLEYRLGFPEISPKNINELADVLTKLTTSLGVATMNDWIDNKQASSIVQSFIEKDMGIELPEPEETNEEEPVY